MKLDLYKLAEEKDITVLEKLFTDYNRGAAFLKDGKWYITVNILDPQERKNFTIAHEIAEIELFHRKDLTLDEKHRLANIRASEILLPDEHFKQDIQRLNLPELKEKYPQASYEVIARKTLKYKNRVLTIFDNGAKTLRTGSDGFAFRQDLMALEKEILKICYEKKETVVKENSEAGCEAYFIDEGRGIERVILFTEEAF